MTMFSWQSIVFFSVQKVFAHIAMTSFEVAEAVLGVIPLVVSALENYRNGVRSLRKWMKSENNIQCLNRNITVERVRLQNVCEKLLDGLVPPSQIDAMVDNPSGDL